MTKKILVAYDGSKPSKEAVLEAKNHSVETPEREIHIVSVVKPTGPFTNKAVSKQIGDELAKNYEFELQEIKQEIESENVSVVTTVLVGELENNPGEKVCEYAEDNDIDFIIVGSRGLGNVKRIFLGSVSNNIVQHATCPVLVIK
ncbi:universal stress protein [Halobacillus mangrovi]|uniref:universal stress protein n=1 Tax=Halobacillus mangrovi TaxID=402384 RepID=UPI003D981640